jgi:ankyrin repeat protein
MNFSTEFRKLIIQDASIEIFESLLSRNCDCNALLEEDEPDSIINLSVLRNRLDVVKLLVKKGASLEPIAIEELSSELHSFEEDESDRFTDDPLFTSAIEANQEIFNFLAPLSAPAQRRSAIICLANGIKRKSCSIGQDVVPSQLLIDSQPDMDEPELFGQWLTDLMVSTISENDPIIAYQSEVSKFIQNYHSQLSDGLNLNHVGDNGCTLLWTAAHNGYYDAVTELIELNSSVDISNEKDGWSPLMIAIDAHIPWIIGTQSAWNEMYSKQISIIERLLEAGASINVKGKKGETISDLLLSYQTIYSREEGFDENVISLAVKEIESMIIS